MKDDPLWLPFGETRNEVVDKIISIRKKYPKYVVNTEKQISLMKGNWGGNGTIQSNVLHGQYFLWTTREDQTTMLHRKF